MNANNAILTEIQDIGVGVITLNRPERHNAFDESMIQGLSQAFKQMEQNPVVKLILLKSTGDSFSAGADLTWMKRMIKFSIDENLHDAGTLRELMHTIYYCLKPTIARVQGNAFGGGVGLVACCHIVIAAQNAHFCFSETKLGLIPAVISPFVIHAIGARAARAYFLSAESFDAQRAKELGLVHNLVAQNDLEKATQILINNLLSNGPHALRAVNALLNKISITPEIAQLTVQKLVEVRTSIEGQEGVNAFLEKRKPSWVNDHE